ncbi:type II toxin-antitoxin system Phd/YefM family antitoxin [uncultured Sphingomonas sp.]|uniref:type II toxin-antitoxin system Phd/YefM family antitoxin n=1 Tax=uncultured Sphingomonas sp. TaxID=158754 RepID=UPI0035CC587F
MSAIKYVGAAEFKANCLRLMDEVQAGGETITITKRGKPVAVMSAVKPEEPRKGSLIGCMAGTVIRYDDPFSPAVDLDEIDAARDESIGEDLYR